MIIVEPDAKIKGLGIVFRCIDEVTTGKVGSETMYRRSPTGYSNGVNALDSEGLKIINAAQLAYARLNTVIERSIVTKGTYLQEYVVCIPKAKHRIYLVRKPDIEADNCLNQINCGLGREEDVLKSLEEHLESLPSKICLPLDTGYTPNKKGMNLLQVSTKEFSTDSRTRWLFGELAEEYGIFLRQDAKVRKIYFHLATPETIDMRSRLQIFHFYHDGSKLGFGITGYQDHPCVEDYVCGIRADTPDKLQDVPKRGFVGQPERITLGDILRHTIHRNKLLSEKNTH